MLLSKSKCQKCKKFSWNIPHLALEATWEESYSSKCLIFTPIKSVKKYMVSQSNFTKWVYQRCSCWCVYDFDDEIFIAEHETKSHTVKTSLCLYQTCTNIFPNSNCFHQQLIIRGDLQSANFKVSAILNSESEWPLFFESCWSVCALCACLAPDLSFE